MAHHGEVPSPGLGEEPAPPWEVRRAPRSSRRGRRGSRRRAAPKRWNPAKLGILGGAVLAVVLVVVLSMWLLGGEDAQEESADGADEEIPPEELVAEYPPQEHGDLADVPTWDPAAHGLDENIGELCLTVSENAGDLLAGYELVDTGPNFCTWEAAGQGGATPTLGLMLYGPLEDEDTEELYVERLAEQIRAARGASGSVEAGPVYELPAGDEGFIRHAVEGSGEGATAEVHAGVRHGGYVTLLSLEDAPAEEEQQLYTELTDLLTALAR